MYNQYNQFTPVPQPDYSQMSLRQELEARFAELEKQEQNARQTPVPNNYPQMLPQQEPSVWDKISSAAAPAYAGAKGFAIGAYGAAKDMAGELYQGGEAFGDTVAQGINKLKEFKDNYFPQRNAYNRYKSGCTPSNVVYNTISSIQKLPEEKTPFSAMPLYYRLALDSVYNTVLNSNKYGKAYKKANTAGKYTACLHNVLDEADCFQ